jgi:hypothetical protein
MTITRRSRRAGRVGAGLMALALSTTAQAQTFGVAEPSAEKSDYAPRRAEAVAGMTRAPLPIGNWKLTDLDERYWRSPSGDLRAAQIATPQPRPPRKHSRTTRIAQRITAMVALGFGGFLAGGLLGAAIEGDSCNCDDPGLYGFIVGAPIGAGVGAAVGAILTR